ncbi:carboxypeptidase-like regulatory domain-containing protein [Flavobacterium caeni]|uniref:CarboxypepD_reg-like domain-containing protein n=1 Tax=Flavobacterium caeni TaxID=490189 RepID=A0A1G5GV36_9FLAO|nr:carboxypeptidase-like regulatory domain-containing protein [Flavobacterium caeni]SCY55475.1 CarboxypepD_reg-like domain-containing protein [Flavobacterium caeni]
MKKLVLSILIAMQVVVGFAQSGTGVTGKVVDSKTQKPMQNVVATIQNANLTQVTDVTGKFTFNNLAAGSQVMEIKTQGYKAQLLQVELTAGNILDLGVVVLEEDITEEQQLALITITENDLGDDNSGSESTSGLLQASRDAYQQAAAFNWGQARFRIRGLDNEYGTTMINGVVMNKLYDGRPQWSNWGGLNDATRNQEFTMGSHPSDYTFGGILGTQEINTRASIYRPGSRISFSGTNTNYSWRMMGTHASGMNTNGWAFVVSASRRWAQEGYFDGTDYAANSLFLSVEKKFNDKHSLNFTSIYAQNSRGKNSPNTQEVTDLLGHKYNSYWGWQGGEKRNSRDKDVEEPINILSHYWKISPRTNLNTNVAYQTGRVANSRLENPIGNNPDPTYYRKLPSYYLNYHATSGPLEGQWQPNYVEANNNLIKLFANRQIDWGSMYVANQNTATGEAAHMLTEQRNDDDQFTANSILSSQLADHISLNAGATFRKLKSHNYAVVTDLLGADYYLNVDPFFVGDEAQFDLNNPNGKVYEGGKAGYNYNLFATTWDAFTQFKFNYRVFDFYLAQTYSRSEYQREGLFRNGHYPNTSFGKGAKISYENFGFKGGLTYKMSGRSFFDLNAVYMTKAPSLRNTFANARNNNAFTPGVTDETVTAGDLSYILRAPKLKARLTAFYSKIQNTAELQFYYAENISDETDNEDSFISELLTGIDKQNIGVELGIEYQITPTIEINAAANYGQYTYTNNPNLKINDDALALSNRAITDFGPAYIKDYRVSGTPQQAYSLGIEYRSPKFWWVGVNGNYLADNYLDVSSVLRTDNFTIGPNGVSFDGASPDNVRKALQQEKFDDFYLVNLTGGKSWKIKSTTFGVFATVNNVLDQIYKSGGFEQSRKATYPDYVQDTASGTRGFGPKYFYGYGRTYFVNLYVNF